MNHEAIGPNGEVVRVKRGRTPWSRQPLRRDDFEFEGMEPPRVGEPVPRWIRSWLEHLRREMKRANNSEDGV